MTRAARAVRPAWIGAVAAAAVLTGCASQVAGNGEVARVVGTGIVAAAQAGPDNRSLVSDDQGVCIGEALVDDLGQDGLVDAGVLSEDHQSYGRAPRHATPEVAGAWVNAFSECLDLRAFYVGLTRITVEGTLDPVRDDVWSGVQTCVDDAVPLSDVEAVLRSLLQGQSTATSSADAFNQCITLANVP